MNVQRHIDTETKTKQLILELLKSMSKFFNPLKVLKSARDLAHVINSANPIIHYTVSLSFIDGDGQSVPVTEI